MVAVSIVFQVDGLKNSLKVEEIQKYTNILQGKKLKSLEEAFYVVKGLKALSKEVPAPEVCCIQLLMVCNFALLDPLSFSWFFSFTHFILFTTFLKNFILGCLQFLIIKS